MTVKEFKIQYVLGTLSWNIKCDIAENINTFVEILKILTGKDEHLADRLCVANNSTAPIELLKILSTDVHWWVRNAVADNPNTPKDILILLKADDDPAVAKSAQKRLYDIFWDEHERIGGNIVKIGKNN